MSSNRNKSEFCANLQLSNTRQNRQINKVQTFDFFECLKPYFFRFLCLLCFVILFKSLFLGVL